MKLIARKPCSFGGKKYFIGDEIPSEEVIQPKAQERLGVLTILTTDEETEKKLEAATSTGSKKNAKRNLSRIPRMQTVKQKPKVKG